MSDETWTPHLVAWNLSSNSGAGCTRHRSCEKNAAGYSDSIWDSALYHIANLLNHLIIGILPFPKFTFRKFHASLVIILRVFFQPKKTYSTCFLPLSPGRPNPGTCWVYLVTVGGRPPCRFSHHHVLISLPKALESTYLAIFKYFTDSLRFPKKNRRFPVTKLPFGVELRSCEVAIIWPDIWHIHGGIRDFSQKEKPIYMDILFWWLINPAITSVRYGKYFSCS